MRCKQLLAQSWQRVCPGDLAVVMMPVSYAYLPPQLGAILSILVGSSLASRQDPHLSPEFVQYDPYGPRVLIYSAFLKSAYFSLSLSRAPPPNAFSSKLCNFRG